jgi:hypothetical protein
MCVSCVGGGGGGGRGVCAAQRTGAHFCVLSGIPPAPSHAALPQTVYDACMSGTLSPFTAALAAEDCRDEVKAEFLLSAPPGTVLTGSVDIDWLATQYPSEVRE